MYNDKEHKKIKRRQKSTIKGDEIMLIKKEKGSTAINTLIVIILLIIFILILDKIGITLTTIINAFEKFFSGLIIKGGV